MFNQSDRDGGSMPKRLEGHMLVPILLCAALYLVLLIAFVAVVHG